MAEYIDKHAAIDALTERNLVVHMDSVNDGLVASCHRSAQRIIANIPAADVRHVVKAAWEQVEVRYEDELIDNPVQSVASMFCPNCKRYHNEVYFYGMPTERVNFCPNCGAEMREESGCMTSL